MSTYPPTHCGIATFTRSLIDSLEQIGGESPRSGVIRLRQTWDVRKCEEPEVVAEAEVASIGWPQAISRWSAGHDLLWVQHEFGIFGPDDGLGVLELCQASPLPVAASLHTVLASPTARQRRIIEDFGAATEVLVVMSQHARRRLVGIYDIDHQKVHVVPHGAQFSLRRSRPVATGRRPTVVNWGLIGPGKGLEWGIRAMALLDHIVPRPQLVIRGTTHPNVRRREGELYRDQLLKLIDTLGLEDSVDVRDGYMTIDELGSLIDGADLALLPYDTTEQVTSGVLVDAVGAGLPVVATAFPHAIEVLSSGAGQIVDHRNPRAIAQAIEHLLTNPPAMTMAIDEAMRVGKEFAWPRVALEYKRLARLAMTRVNMSAA
ncbi:MAG: glycosyltransferase [Acidimicrobiia bacterium]